MTTSRCLSYCVLYMFVFFFKQKTAYEMRISDWSSDVCSSDLEQREPAMRHDDRIEFVAVKDQQASAVDGGMHRLFPDLDTAEIRACELAEIGRASCRERVCQYV